MSIDNIYPYPYSTVFVVSVVQMSHDVKLDRIMGSFTLKIVINKECSRTTVATL